MQEFQTWRPSTWERGYKGLVTRNRCSYTSIAIKDDVFLFFWNPYFLCILHDILRFIWCHDNFRGLSGLVLVNNEPAIFESRLCHITNLASYQSRPLGHYWKYQSIRPRSFIYGPYCHDLGLIFSVVQVMNFSPGLLWPNDHGRRMDSFPEKKRRLCRLLPRMERLQERLWGPRRRVLARTRQDQPTGTSSSQSSSSRAGRLGGQHCVCWVRQLCSGQWSQQLQTKPWYLLR